MRKIGYFTVILFSTVIAVFIFWGEDIYSALATHVHAVKVSVHTNENGSFIVVPKTAVKNEGVYVIESKSGFKISHSVATRREVLIINEINEDEIIIRGISEGENIVLEADNVEDGYAIIIIH